MSHLDRMSVPVTPEKYLQTLLGKLNFILQYEDRDSALFSDRDWLVRELQNAAMVMESSGKEDMMKYAEKLL